VVGAHDLGPTLGEAGAQRAQRVGGRPAGDLATAGGGAGGDRAAEEDGPAGRLQRAAGRGGGRAAGHHELRVSQAGMGRATRSAIASGRCLLRCQPIQASNPAGTTARSRVMALSTAAATTSGWWPRRKALTAAALARGDPMSPRKRVPSRIGVLMTPGQTAETPTP